jgi:mono/diheme cytochrome c family protein
MRAVALVVGMGVAAAGCGGGSTSSTTPTTAGSPQQATGAHVFATAGCSNCHTLAAAGAHGQVGPNLDQLRPSAAAVEQQVRNGGGGMPAFSGSLSSNEITAVAAYVAHVAGQ